MVNYDDAIHNLARLPLIIDAFQRGDLYTVSELMEDRLQTPALQKHLTAIDEVIEAAASAGADAVTISGNGPALVAFARSGHAAIADAIRGAFDKSRVDVQTWILPVDRQGIVVSMSQTSR